MVNIMHAGREHIPQIVEIENASFSVPWSEQSFIAELEAEGCIFLTAVEEGKVLGFCILRPFMDEGEIFNIAVAESARGCGTGEALLTAAMSEGFVVGVRRLFLEVRESNLPAIGLYKKLGFETVGVRKNYYESPRENAVLMAAKLD
jgi:ribosomal-protein-alanine N-acetyltransferase